MKEESDVSIDLNSSIKDVDKYILSCEIEIPKYENFNVVSETLERIGMAKIENKDLYQSCHLFQKKGKLYIAHFKELYALDGKLKIMSYKDLAIRNLIAQYLENWGLIKLVKNNIERDEPIAESKTIRIISHKDRKNWNLIPKYILGHKRKQYIKHNQ